MNAPSLSLARNGSRLVLNENGSFHFLFAERYRWESAGPLLVIHYYDRQHPRAQTVAVPTAEHYVFGTPGTLSQSARPLLTSRPVSETEGELEIDLPQIRIGLRLAIRMDASGNGFSLQVISIREEHERLYRLLSIEVLPEFGAARSGEAGYLILPNWAGCQTFFDKTYPREVRQTIYSSNDQWEQACTMPVFGIHRDIGTLCGLVSAGDTDARLISRVHWEERQANATHPEWVYRWEQHDPLLEGPREVRYHFAPPDYEDGEGYVFCGKVYRQFLRKERGLLSWREKAEKRPVVLDYRNRFFLKIFMAYKDPHPEGRGEYHVSCRFDEAREIIAQCLADGLRHLVVILVGWGRDGHDGMPPTRFPVDERLGGENGLRQLNQWCRENDVMLGVHDSYGAMYTCSPEFDTGDLVRHRSGEYWESVIWSGGQAHIICPSVFVEKHVKRDIPAVHALGLYGHHHIDAVGSFMTCFSPDHPLEKRKDYMNEVRKMFRIASDTIGSVSTEMPFGAYFDVVDGFFHSFSRPFSFHKASPVGRFFLDRSIPLLTIALHGSVNCGEGIGGTALHHLDWGLVPVAEVSLRPAPPFGIAPFENARERLKKAYALHYGDDRLRASLADSWIEARRELSAGVHETRYSNGTIVTVNLSKETFDGIASSDFCIEQTGVPA